jgi:hypothetical protein
MSQCLGRHVKDGPKGVNMLSFEEGAGLFHLPLRCQMITRSGDLCDGCVAKEAKTMEKIKEIRGTTISGPHPSYLMGRVTDPVPYWSRIYDGEWFRLKIESGCRVSEENMVKARKAVEKAYEGVTTVEPAPMPGGARKIKAKVAAAPAAPEEPKAPEPKVQEPKRRANVKKPVQSVEPLFRVEGPPVDISEDTVLRIKVRKVEVDERQFFLDPKKDKLYDLKFKYVGRLRDGAIVAHPDSDAEGSA